MHGLLQEPPQEHLSQSILSFQNFYGGICLYLAQLSVKFVICRLSFVCYHCLEYVRSVVLKLFEIAYHLMCLLECTPNVLKINIAHKRISNISITHERIITQKRINKVFRIWQETCSRTTWKAQFENHCVRWYTSNSQTLVLPFTSMCRNCCFNSVLVI